MCFLPGAAGTNFRRNWGAMSRHGGAGASGRRTAPWTSYRPSCLFRFLLRLSPEYDPLFSAPVLFGGRGLFFCLYHARIMYYILKKACSLPKKENHETGQGRFFLRNGLFCMVLCWCRKLGRKKDLECWCVAENYLLAVHSIRGLKKYFQHPKKKSCEK